MEINMGRPRKFKTKFLMDLAVSENGGVFIANDAVGEGNLFVQMRDLDYLTPVAFNFQRGKIKCGFNMSRQEARKLILYLLAIGV
jgi:hypothetical protein